MVLPWVLNGFLALFSLYYLRVLASALLDKRAMPSLSDRRYRQLSGDAPLAPLDIVIPARNEAGKLMRCLDSLAKQTHRDFQVWMVNDRSSDGTGELMSTMANRDARFHRIDGVEPPPGWAGKVHAMAQAFPHLTAETVLFLDADTCLHPDTLSRTLRAMREDGIDFLSLLPLLECETFWERVIQPTMTFLIANTLPIRQVNDPRRPDVAIANGQFILINRAVYEALGTHTAIQGSIVEDLHLAQRAKQAGVRFRLYNGADCFRVRMYTNFAELREGWTKNMYLGNPKTPEKSAAVTAFKVLGLWLLALLPFITLALQLGLHLPTHVAYCSYGAWAMMTVAIAISRTLYDAAPAYAWTHPLGLFVAACWYWESRCRALSKTGVTWKGRHYSALET